MQIRLQFQAQITFSDAVGMPNELSFLPFRKAS